MERVVVTGSTGFIGSRLSSELSNRGFDVICSPHGDVGRIECDRIYHLACPSSTMFIQQHTQQLINIIIDGTRRAYAICPDAVFINASSMGASQITLDESPQQAYNVAKRLMELYFAYSRASWINYRLPAVYGDGMSDDAYIKRCVDGIAYYPTHPQTLYHIAHVDDVVESLITLSAIKMEEITLGEIYEVFGTGGRGLHRPTLGSHASQK